MLWKRIVSAMIGIPLLLGVVYLGGWVLTITVTVLAIIGFHEYRLLMHKLDVYAPGWLGYPLVIALALTAHYGGNSLQWLITFAALGSFLHLMIAFPHSRPQNSAVAVMGAISVGWLLSHLILLRQLPSGMEAVLITFFITWATDTGAYFVGRAIGRRPLAPRLSPKKTVEGTIGGLVSSALVGGYFGSLWFPHIGLGLWLIASFVLSAIGQMGDLAESALKRVTGEKDSGTLIPGHGGVLDRFDSVLWTAPAIYYFFLVLRG